MRQAIARTAPTAPSSSSSEPRTSPTTSSARAATSARTSRFVSGNAAASRSETARICARASSLATPGRRRATTFTSWSPRFARSSAGKAAGRRTDTGRVEPSAPGVTNPGGRTPTTRRGSRSSRMVRPTIAGSAAKRPRQRASERITTRSPSSRSSSRTKGRPITGPAPRTAKKSEVTACPTSDSGRPSPLRSVSTKRPGGHRLERGHPVVGEVGRRHREPVSTVRLPERDEALGLGIRQGPQEHRVHEGEERRVRPDAESQRQRGRDREAG